MSPKQLLRGEYSRRASLARRVHWCTWPLALHSAMSRPRLRAPYLGPNTQALAVSNVERRSLLRENFYGRLYIRKKRERTRRVVLHYPFLYFLCEYIFICMCFLSTFLSLTLPFFISFFVFTFPCVALVLLPCSAVLLGLRMNL